MKAASALLRLPLWSFISLWLHRFFPGSSRIFLAVKLIMEYWHMLFSPISEWARLQNFIFEAFVSSVEISSIDAIRRGICPFQIKSPFSRHIDDSFSWTRFFRLLILVLNHLQVPQAWKCDVDGKKQRTKSTFPAPEDQSICPSVGCSTKTQSATAMLRIHISLSQMFVTQTFQEGVFRHRVGELKFVRWVSEPQEPSIPARVTFSV